MSIVLDSHKRLVGAEIYGMTLVIWLISYSLSLIKTSTRQT